MFQVARIPTFAYSLEYWVRKFCPMRKTDAQTEKEMPAAGPPEPEPLVAVPPEPLTPEQLEELKDRAAKAAEHWDRLLRTTADFENFKKRAAREKQEAIKFANESLLQKLIPVLDHFDMALAAAQNAQADGAQSLHAGINMIYQQLKTLLVE